MLNGKFRTVWNGAVGLGAMTICLSIPSQTADPANYTDPDEPSLSAADGQEAKMCQPLMKKKISLHHELRDAPYHIEDGMAVVEGDIVIATASHINASAYRPLAVPYNRWDKGEIPYKIDDVVWKPDDRRRQSIEEAISYWERATDHAVHFKRWMPSDVNFIFFTGKPINDTKDNVCNSWVGMQGEQQDVHLDSQCSPRTTVHEIGHALGLSHEQSRNDRDKKVKINWDNIESEGKRHNFCRVYYNTQKSEDLDDMYDFASIMHYAIDDFGKSCPNNPRKKCITIEPLPGSTTLDPMQIGKLEKISEGDAAAVKKMYPRDKTKGPVPKQQCTIFTETIIASNGKKTTTTTKSGDCPAPPKPKLPQTDLCCYPRIHSRRWPCDIYFPRFAHRAEWEFRPWDY